MDTIRPLSPVAPLHSTTDQRGEGKNPFTKFGIGEFVRAEVLEARSNNLFTLDLSGSKISATANRYLSVGENLLLQVTKLSPSIELTVIPEPSNLFAGRNLALFAHSVNVHALFTQLQEGNPAPFSDLSPATQNVLNLFASPNDSSLLARQNGGEFLRHLLRNLGISLESQVNQGEIGAARNSLKSGLFEILSRFISS